MSRHGAAGGTGDDGDLGLSVLAAARMRLLDKTGSRDRQWRIGEREGGSMGWDYGEQVEITIGDGKGRVQVSGTPYVWCRTADRGRVLQVQWLSAEPVPPEGTHVIAQWLLDGLRCPPVGT